MESVDCSNEVDVNDWLFIDETSNIDENNDNITNELIQSLRKNDKLHSRWVNGVPKWATTEYLEKFEITEIHASTYDSYQRGTIAKWVIDEFLSRI